MTHKAQLTSNSKAKLKRKICITLKEKISIYIRGSPPAMQKTWVQPLGQEDSLEKEMAIHPNNLAWDIPWTEESGWL